MAGIKKTKEKILGDTKSILKKPWTIADPSVASKGFQRAVDLFTPEVPEPVEETIIPIPDERVAALDARKRRAKGSRTGRDSTILTEGLGG